MDCSRTLAITGLPPATSISIRPVTLPPCGASVCERIQIGRNPKTIFQTVKKRYQIIPMLRRADVDLGKGSKVPEVCKMLGVDQQTYCRWRQKYGGMAPEMTGELKALQKENAHRETTRTQGAYELTVPAAEGSDKVRSRMNYIFEITSGVIE